MRTRSWQEMRGAATRFATEWRDETRERAEKDSFWNEWFGIFGIDRRRVAVFEHLSTRHSTGGRGFMDVFWPGYVAAEHKSRGSDLTAAMEQALDYLPAIPAEHLPRLVVVSDFARFRVRNQLNGEEVEFSLEDLPARLRTFAPMLDAEMTQYETEEDVNLKATELLALLHDALRESGYEGHALRVLLVRLVFILFADDTQVWETGHFYDYLLLKTAVDGHDLGPALVHLFQVLDTPKERRSTNLDDDLARFEYINGGLFAETLPIPACTRTMRERLLQAARFDWSKISPAIFGSLFQNVMEPAERRNLGAHYTTEQNILRTIEPLFLNDLRAELDAATTLPALRRFRDKLAELTWFDPAAGCGNFLVIAYREVRRLELDCLKQIRGRERGSTAELTIDVQIESKVRVGQFYGIEIEEFPARIAETAIYLVDHLANLELSAAFGQYYARFPIRDSAHITIGNALRVDWNDVLPARQATYLFGNPPFHGMSWMTAEQQEDNRLVFTEAPVTVGRSGRLDYVACWYAKAIGYMQGTSVRAAFVSTNSITQGEQARSLGPALRDAGFDLLFAHRTFEWTSEARGKAHVHVVIIGFAYGQQPGRKLLVDYPTAKTSEGEVSTPPHLNWYLADGVNVFPAQRRQPLLAGLPPAVQGNKPWDGGGLIVEPEAIDEVRADPLAAKYLRPYRQATEFLWDEPRWCLWLVDADPGDLRASRVLRERLQVVRQARLDTKTVAVQQQAATPALFNQIRQPSSRYLALPEVSSERRPYVPAGFLEADIIAGNKLITIEGADLWVFGVLQSRMWMAWVGTIAGRMKSDISLAPGLVYNAFPFPDHDGGRRDAAVMEAAQGVLDARAVHPESSLGVLYDPLAMPSGLVRAHQQLDRAVDTAYGRARYVGDAARLHALFERYAKLTNADSLPGVGIAVPRRRRVG
ncbi:Type II restriction/modification system, DNA methylase subunit YeeA [Blastococcus tunisiensis]|uniref:site-specific DNA-methyltransferase (adenine-specific) n=2 Tax=Blastococcus tunisiensis TaxID=1798228 RepID=A0A1I2I1Q6_9ACTN|nr:Type II restriction/modification system, DNA methylase subunit YeeA [Blastococcus sp. DSM 46838]